ncbi:hypothetical protein ACO2Q0_04180 [Phenylobacterium sp. VNQ135]|uniref:hypothetical protein n=1 Tax=Phenylobacterium sp. VNQ135 TaxID=3400922 RepID=UPI003C0F5E33
MTDIADLRRPGSRLWPAIRAALPAASRHLAALFGGWWFACGFVALATFGLTASGMSFDDARLLSWMLGFLVLLAAVCWAYVPRSSWRPWLVLGGGGTSMGVAAWALARTAMG